MTETTPTHRRWVGSLLSLLLPGAGIYLAGNKRRGRLWFVGLLILWLVRMVVMPMPIIPGLYATLILLLCTFALWGWMLVSSYRSVPKLNFRSWAVVLPLALTFYVIKQFGARPVVHPFNMPTGSMEQTLLRGDHILVQTCAYWFSKPQRGDVVVFKTDSVGSPPLPQGQYYVKRIVALPGERVQVSDRRL